MEIIEILCLIILSWGLFFFKFQENSCKTFHGGISDLKYIPRTVKHVCHEEGVKHEPCLVEIYRLYIGLVEVFAKNGNAFTARHLRPNLVLKKFQSVLTL